MRLVSRRPWTRVRHSHRVVRVRDPRHVLDLLDRVLPGARVFPLHLRARQRTRRGQGWVDRLSISLVFSSRLSLVHPDRDEYGNTAFLDGRVFGQIHHKLKRAPHFWIDFIRCFTRGAHY